MMIMIIGAGGVTSHMLPQLLKMCDSSGKITVVDGDELEEKNLDRQLFRPQDIGKNKAMALRQLYPQINVEPEYLTERNAKQLFDKYSPDVVFVAVDNHDSRKLVLDYLDELEGTVGIFGVNEYFDSQSYCYRAEWMNTRADPRIRYPEILVKSERSPQSCQGESAESTPQLAIANAMSGCMMMHLFWVHVIKYSEITHPQAREELPYDIRRSFTDYRVENWTI